MPTPLRVLMVEHSDAEALRLAEALREGGCEPQQLRVDTAEALAEALEQGEWDVVLAGAGEPSFGAQEALQVLRRRGAGVPLIAVWEGVDAEQAMAVLRAGADDVVFRRNLAGLVLSVQAQLREAEARREQQRADAALRESESRFRRIVETASEGIWELGAGEKTVYANQQMADMLGYTREEMIGRPLFDFMDEADYAWAQECIARRRPGSMHRDEFHFRRKDGSDLWALVGTQPVLDSEGRIVGALGMLTDITARKRTEKERQELLERERASREAAEEASAARDRFIALLSHELRNPLAPVLAGIPVVRRALPPGGRAQRTLDIMERNIRLQARLVTDLLDLSAIVRGKVLLQRQPVDLDGIVRAAVEAHREEAARASLALECRLGPPMRVCADPARLQRALESLLSNAIRFTPSGGRVGVAVRECGVETGGGAPETGAPSISPSSVSGSPSPVSAGAPADQPTVPGPRPPAPSACIVVEDTGVGIDPGVKPRIFEVFQRGETGGWRTPGLGIGLALVKAIVDGHGGRVWVESEGPGKGSRFTIELPLLAAEEPAGGEAPGGEPGAPDVLVVGRDADTRVLLADSLELLGYAVRAAEDEEAALEMMRQAPPRALVIDTGAASPDGDGRELLRKARELPGMAFAPAFAIIGEATEEDAERRDDAGYAGWFSRPVDLHALEQRLRESLGVGAASGSG